MNIRSIDSLELPDNEAMSELVTTRHKSQEFNSFKLKNIPNGIKITSPIPGVIEVVPTAINNGKRKVVLMSGIHGDEKQGIILCDKILNLITQGHLSPNVALSIIYGNPEAMSLNQRNFSNGLNLNRYAHTQQARAAEIKHSLDGLDTLFDLHASFNTEDAFSITYLSGKEAKKPLEIQYQLAQTRGLTSRVVLRETDQEQTSFAGMAKQILGARSSHTLELGSVGNEKNEAVRMQQIIPELINTLRGFSPDRNITDNRKLYTVLGDILKQDVPERVQAVFDRIQDFSSIPEEVFNVLEGETKQLLLDNPKALPLFAKREQGGERSGVLITPYKL